jgi:mannan endo-1,4-beta-mannosidase
MKQVAAFHEWIDESARLLKTLSPGQLVTTGSEGMTSSPLDAGLDVVEDHRSAAIDFVTFHLWAQNWSWVRPEHLDEDFPRALELARAYVRDHAECAAQLGKPLLLEEFGFPRDGGSFDPGAPTRARDRYFEELYALVHALLEKTPMAGIMPWAWAGDVRPPRPGDYWRPGDPLAGDPPHEQQGWYGVYGSDSTLEVLRAWSPRIAAGPR